MIALQTPCGILRCKNQHGTDVPFQAIPLEHDFQAAVYDLISETWIPVKPEQQLRVFVYADAIEPGDSITLKIHSSLQYRFGASDENAISNVITYSDYSESLGAYDPNDAEKDIQAVPVYDGAVRIGFKAPAQYDESKFRGYLLQALPDWSGFTAKLLDRTIPEITFRLAWIRHINRKDFFAETADYENAVTRITTF